MDLLTTAIAVREKAYAPYSKFHVGAAIRSASGKIYAGCNVENVAYPEGTCAEAGAIAAMIADGETEISEILVVARGPVKVSPCGGCRQKISEFAQASTIVFMADMSGDIEETTIADLLPAGFDKDHLDVG
ncbi:MAG: cytidine deaminase [Paracoccaceae bacterium]